MDDSFRVRVDRVFGSLNATEDAGVSPASWCLSDDKIERREWRRHKDDDDADGEEELEDAKDEGVEREDEVSGSFVSEDQFESDLQELSGNEGDEEEKGDEEGVAGEKSGKSTGDDASEEFLDVQANIGRDCTLDHEEEEDEYDKVAVGKDHSGDRLYLKDVKHSDYEIEQFTSHGQIPTSFNSHLRDPRANHEAAKARLKEDSETAGDFHTLQLSENSSATPHDKISSESNGEKPKPILKRKQNPTSSRSQKRVRFSIDGKSSAEADEGPRVQEDDGDSVSEPNSSNHGAVPDYVRNPSRYTRYTFDSTEELDDRSNREAYMDLFNHLRKNSGDESSGTEDKTPGEIGNKTIVFTPKKKPGAESVVIKNEGECVKGGPSTVSEAAMEEKASAMEEDEGPAMVSKQRQNRHYRTKANAGLEKDDDDDMQG